MNFLNFVFTFQTKFSIFWKMKLKLRILNIYVTMLRIILEKFLDNWNKNSTVIALLLFLNRIFKNVNEIVKIRMNSEKSINSFEKKWLGNNKCT